MTSADTTLLWVAATQGSETPWPSPPTRWQLATAKSSFQGLMADLPSFGSVPFTDGVWTSPAMTLPDRLAAYAAKRAAGDTIATLNVSWAYREPGLPFNPPGRDLTNDLPTLKSYVVEAIEQGFYVELSLAMDGLSKDPDGNDVPWGYEGPFGVNDPVGDTYGLQWGMVALPGIYAAMGPTEADPRDCRPYIRWRPGYDGCIPAWAGPRNEWWHTDVFLMFVRSIIGAGVLAMEFSAGYWSWSGEDDDFAAIRDVPGYGRCQPGDNIDTVQYEGPVPMGPTQQLPIPSDFCRQSNEIRAPYDQVWQISKRFLGPTWLRPADMPACDDPGIYNGGPLAHPTSRGPRALQAYEPDTYLWSRQRISSAQVETDAKYLRQMNWPIVSVPDSMLAV